MWFLGALFYCYGFFLRVSPAVMVDEMMREFAVGAAITGMLSGLYFYTYAGIQIPIGLLLDRYGPRRMLTIFALLSAAGCALFAIATGLGPAYLGRALIGLGTGVTWVGALKLASMWFPPRRFALVTGLTLAMGTAGAVGGQAPLTLAVAAFGWRGTIWMAGAFGVALAAVIWLLVRDGRTAEPVARTASQSLGAGLKLVLGNSQTYVLALYGMTMVAPMLSFAGLWGVPYLVHVHGLDRGQAAFTTSAMLVGFGIGSPLTGWISDRSGRRRPMMLLSSVLALACSAAAIYLPGIPIEARQALLFLTGLTGGGFVLSFATGREHSPAWASGAALGVVNTGSMSSGAIFQPLIGWVLDLNWDGTLAGGSRIYSAGAYEAALLLLIGCYGSALLLAVLTRETFCRHQR